MLVVEAVLYHYVVRDWLQGDPTAAAQLSAGAKLEGRNHEWTHLY